MVPTGVAVAGGLGLLAALVYAALGRRELRHADRSRHPAAAAVAIFWLALALHLALDSAWGIAGATSAIDPAVSGTVLHLKVATGAAAFAGLVFHVLYLYSGRVGTARLVGAYFMLVFALVEHNYIARAATGHEMTAWAARHTFAFEGGAFEDVALAMLFLPGIVASVAYAMLARATGIDPALRRRVLFRALALCGFFGGLLVGFIADWPWWEPVERLIALTTGIVALVGAPHQGDVAARAAPQSS